MHLDHLGETVDLTELFSPPRLTGKCELFGLKPGSAIDLRTDPNLGLRKSEDVKRLWHVLEKEQPLLVVRSPPCTMFSV